MPGKTAAEREIHTFDASVDIIHRADNVEVLGNAKLVPAGKNNFFAAVVRLEARKRFPKNIREVGTVDLVDDEDKFISIIPVLFLILGGFFRKLFKNPVLPGIGESDFSLQFSFDEFTGVVFLIFRLRYRFRINGFTILIILDKYRLQPDDKIGVVITGVELHNFNPSPLFG